MARLQFTVTVEHPSKAIAEDVAHSLGNLMQLIVQNNDTNGAVLVVSLPLWLSERPLSGPTPSRGGEHARTKAQAEAEAEARRHRLCLPGLEPEAARQDGPTPPDPRRR